MFSSTIGLITTRCDETKELRIFNTMGQLVDVVESLSHQKEAWVARAYRQ
jgi:hypothetical protein